jgi:hypothetical protein
MAMLIGQLSGRKSLRDITHNLKAQFKRLYHLGMKQTSRATLARVNENQPASLYQVIFSDLFKKYQMVAPTTNSHSVENSTCSTQLPFNFALPPFHGPSTAPGKPTYNALIESFNGSFPDECLNVNWFLSLDDAGK